VFFAINDFWPGCGGLSFLQDGMPVVIVARLGRDGGLKDPQIVSLPAKSVSAGGTEAGATPLDIALSNNDQVAVVDANYDACLRQCRRLELEARREASGASPSSHRRTLKRR